MRRFEQSEAIVMMQRADSHSSQLSEFVCLIQSGSRFSHGNWLHVMPLEGLSALTLRQGQENPKRRSQSQCFCKRVEQNGTLTRARAPAPRKTHCINSAGRPVSRSIRFAVGG